MRFLGAYNPNNNLYCEIRELNEEEYNEYKKAFKRVYSINEDISLFGNVQANYDGYMNVLKDFLPRFMSDQKIDAVTMDQMIGNINLLLANYLTTVITLLDHSELKLKRLYGEKSVRYKNFNDAKSKLYDTYFSYRFLYHLRHYIQHCGMPITGFNGPRFEDFDKENKRAIARLVAYCDRDELLKKCNWKKQLRDEIQNLEPRIDITPHINVMMNCVRDIIRVIIKDDLPELIKNATYLTELMHPAKVKGTPCIYESGPPTFNESIKGNIEWFPVHLIHIIYSLDNILWDLPLFEYKKHL